jgi:ferrous iron transport protein B
VKNEKTIVVALVGNPNAGKTSIFNNLTGAHQKVGNYGGVTVEIKEGLLHHEGCKVKVVDLPGTYSLTAYSIEEIVARDFIVKRQPDVVVNVIDGSNLERNLYLTAQLKELGVPMVLAFNMADEMRQKGISFDRDLLEKELGGRIVNTIGSRNKGTNKLIHEIIRCAAKNDACQEVSPVRYGDEVEAELAKLVPLINERAKKANALKTDDEVRLCKAVSSRWVALKLLEKDEEVFKAVFGDDLAGDSDSAAVKEQLGLSLKRLENMFGEDSDILIAQQRYGYVRGLCRSAIRRSAAERMDISGEVDKVLTNRLLGLPIFAGLMYVAFWLVFTVGEIPMGWIEWTVRRLAELVGAYWPEGVGRMWRSLIIDGVIGGVGGVIVFLPNIALLFTAITLLEDTGYMARAAFIMDRLMKWVGLHGKSFIPMLTGFGCAIPAIMGTRILDNRRDRLTTMLILPLMSCGARLPIYMLIIPAFFGQSHRAMVMYGMYIIGIVVAIICARLLRATAFKGESSPFVMELPPYRIPTMLAVVTHVWQRSRLYLHKAGTTILAFSILMWVLATFPAVPAAQLAGLSAEQAQELTLRYSCTGRIGRFIEPALKPMGFDWKIGTALIGSLPAKELFVSQMGIVYSLGRSDQNTQPLREVLRKTYTPLTGFCIMLFCLISAPCMATVAIMKRESGQWRWAILQFFGLTAIAYLLTVIVYQTGMLFSN